MQKFSSLLMMAAACALSTQALALSATQTIEKEATVIADDGTSRIVRTPVSKVVPGERIVYTLNFTNDDAQPASDLVLTMPVPEEVTYIEGTADRAGAKVMFSADGGDTFSPREATIKMEADGSVNPARNIDITHVRWTVPGPVAVGENGELSFSAVLK